MAPGSGPVKIAAALTIAAAGFGGGFAYKKFRRYLDEKKLRRILTYHVVAGKAMAADVVKMHSAKAVSGDTITVATHGGTVTVDNAKVVKTDIVASNGVIHVIDSVILPEDK